MKKSIAIILMVLTIAIPVWAAPNSPDYVLGILNHNIANYKVLRERKDFTTQEYFDRSWKAYEKAAEDGNMPDLNEMAAFGRVKSQEFIDNKITEDQYRLAMIEKQNELKQQALKRLNIEDGGDYSWLQILGMAAVAVLAVGAAAAVAHNSPRYPYYYRGLYYPYPYYYYYPYCRYSAYCYRR
jgi:hypothetical protein